MSEPAPKDGFPVRATWLHYCLVALFAIILTILSPRGKSLEFSHITLGSVSPARIIAPFDYEILKTPSELQEERERASNAVLPVLVRESTVEDSTRRRLRAFGEAVEELFASLPPVWLAATADSSEEYAGGKGEQFLKGSRALAEHFKLRISGDQWRFLFRLYLAPKGRGGASLREFFRKTVPQVLSPIYAYGLFDRPENEIAPDKNSVIVREGIEEEIVPIDSLLEPTRITPRLSVLLVIPMTTLGLGRANEVDAAAGLIATLSLPNLIYDGVETIRRRDAAVAMVPLAKGFVKQDELIVDSHIRVTQEHFDKLTSLAIKRAEQIAQLGGWQALAPTFGQLILAMVLSLFLWVSLALARPLIWREWKLLLLIAGLLVVALLFYRWLPVRPEMARQLLPAAAVAMLLTIIFDRGVAALGLIVLALASGFIQGNDFQTAATALGMGGTAIISIRSLNSRKSVLRSGFYIGAVAAVIAVAFHFANYSSTETFLGELLAAIGNGVFSPMLVIGVMPIMEGLFGISTDLTLLELVDLNRPLLRELALKSPGTYHHSLMVGSLAEAAASEIGANPILTRAGAYYHDIGKIEIKEYFIENQETGSGNIHDRLPPTKSADIVIGHVQRGLELAEKYKLPPQVTAFITEHHGQTRLAFFHAKAQRELGGEVDESRFRYPGPKPGSKETGVLMLADVVEAATRSLDHPTQTELRETVDRLVATRLEEGDLDNCPLTLNELQRIKESFLRVLMGIHHQRITYPGKIIESGAKPDAATGPTKSIV